MSRDWMFCPISGQLLEMDPTRGAVCELSGYKKDLDELKNLKVVSITDMEGYRRRYKLEPLVKTGGLREEDKPRERATVDEPCPACGHIGLEYYTMQLRSADEGQTVFYECPDCKYRFSQNN